MEKKIAAALMRTGLLEGTEIIDGDICISGGAMNDYLLTLYLGQLLEQGDMEIKIKPERIGYINKLMKIEPAKEENLPELIKEIRSKYNPPDHKFIVCSQFRHPYSSTGKEDCKRCKELTPYQFEMCKDANWLIALTSGGRNRMTKEEAIKRINECKKLDWTNSKEDKNG